MSVIGADHRGLDTVPVAEGLPAALVTPRQPKAKIVRSPFRDP